jgi:hypothetical protein
MNTKDAAADPKKSSPLLEFFNGLRNEIHSPFNEWVTGVAVGHPPTNDEKIVHFLVHGGRENYRKRFLSEHPGALDAVS